MAGVLTRPTVGRTRRDPILNEIKDLSSGLEQVGDHVAKLGVPLSAESGGEGPKVEKGGNGENARAKDPLWVVPGVT